VIAAGALLALLVLAPSAAEAPLVVIDPGHGGAKSGAKTADGTTEAAIVLSVAKHARRSLERAGFRVVLSRDSDRDVPLADRISLANRLGASAFVSIHANWSPVAARQGIETYILSPDASDDEAAALVHLENEEGPPHEAGFGGEGPEASPLTAILGDLSRATAHKDSAAMAKRIQDRLGRVRGLGPSRGLRQAPFLVLRGAQMPAALVELGYLSSPGQGALLGGAALQQRAGDALAEALIGFLRRPGQAVSEPRSEREGTQR
jgi:N-acetylmuramoyl-L-alanine amidase